MKFLIMIYNDDTLLNALAPGEFDTMMHGCFKHADALREEGLLLDSMQLQPPQKTKTVRVRGDKTTVVDGPYTEAREYLGGFNLVEARDMEEAVQIAKTFPWARTGCIEVRPVHDIDGERQRVGA
jgi:hypothetical protein